MTVHQPFAQFQGDIRPVAAPHLRNRGERVFDLHPAVHMALLGLYLSFAGILLTSFMGKDLVVPAAIVVIGILSLFITPGLWSRIAGDDLRKQTLSEFFQEGMECITGRLTAGQALAQIMVLPGLMVGLAIVFAVLKATV